MPEALANLLDRRLAVLDRSARDVLMLGAVCGLEFELATVQACTTATPLELVDVVEFLCRERLLEERDGEQIAFAHEVVRDAVLQSIGASRRARLHRRVGDALAAQGAPAGAVAFHLQAAGAEAAAIATPWMLLAGDDALRRAAWAEADALFAGRSMTRRRLHNAAMR